MGCPARRVAGGLAGAALMRDLDHASRIIESVVAAVQGAGERENAARLGRWRAQRAAIGAPRRGGGRGDDHGSRANAPPVLSTGRADWRAVAEVVAAVGVPVVVNGDCREPRGRPRDARGLGRARRHDRPRRDRRAVDRRGDRARAANRRAVSKSRRSQSVARPRCRIWIRCSSGMGRRAGLRHARKHLAAYAEKAGAAPAIRARAGDERGRRRRHGTPGARLRARRGQGGRMSRLDRSQKPRRAPRGPIRLQLLNALPQPVLAIDADGAIQEVNTAAEHFFDMGRAMLLRSRLVDILPFGSPVIGLVADAIADQATVNGYKLDVSTPRTGLGRVVDAFVSPLPQSGGGVTLLLQERSIAEKMDRQLHPSQRRPLGHRARRHARPRDQEPAVGHPRRRATAGDLGRRRRSRADAADLRRDRPHRQTGRSHGGVFRRAPDVAREPQHPRGARSRQAPRAGRFRPPHPLRRSLRSVVAACAGLARPVDPGLLKFGEERLGSYWRRKH